MAFRESASENQHMFETNHLCIRRAPSDSEPCVIQSRIQKVFGLLRHGSKQSVHHNPVSRRAYYGQLLFKAVSGRTTLDPGLDDTVKDLNTSKTCLAVIYCELHPILVRHK
jgi:hypothetical protein